MDAVPLDFLGHRAAQNREKHCNVVDFFQKDTCYLDRIRPCVNRLFITVRIGYYSHNISCVKRG